MSKPEALVDTCFLQKFSKEGKNVELLKKILENMDFKPVIHPYLCEHELSMYSYVKELEKMGLIRIASYEEFLLDKDDVELYTQQFLELYEQLGEHYKITNSKKHIEPLPEKCDIFTYRKARTSIGDVHIILMAVYLQIPVIFTEDGDIETLKSLARRKIYSEVYQMDIYDALDALKQIIEKSDCPFSKKDIEKLLNEIGKRAYRSELKQFWDTYHGKEA